MKEYPENYDDTVLGDIAWTPKVTDIFSFLGEEYWVDWCRLPISYFNEWPREGFIKYLPVTPDALYEIESIMQMYGVKWRDQ